MSLPGHKGGGDGWFFSCMRKKINDAAKPWKELDLLYAQLQDTARRVAHLQPEWRVIIESQFIPHLTAHLKIVFSI